MQHPMPDWLKVRTRMRPELLRKFRKFLKLIHQIEKRQAAKAAKEAEMSVTPSCGCVFCDLDLEPVDGFHEGPKGERIECTL